LLEYVRLVTEAAYRTSSADVQKLRDAGWKEDQIAEAVYVTALFVFFNRVADAFGVPSHSGLSFERKINPVGSGPPVTQFQ
jgi:alkylhydroperoxidase family enzyme